MSSSAAPTPTSRCARRRMSSIARDRALAMRLAYGAVQRRGTLDYLIERLAERAPQRLDAPLLAALRLGLYELLYLQGAPDRAVVDDAVELAKGAGRGHGLVNAVLRRATREGRGAARGARRRHARARGGHALPPAVDRAAVVGGARARRTRVRCSPATTSRASSRCARTRSSPTRRRSRASCRSAVAIAIRRSPRRSCSTDPSTCTPRRCGARARSWRSRAGRCCRRGRWPHSRASGCSTCARRPAARARTWPR